MMKDRHTDLTDAHSEAHKSNHKAWTRSNRLCLNFMQVIIANNIKSTRSGIENQNAKDFFKLVEEKFCFVDKALAETVMVELTTMKFDGLRSMQQHVLDMTNTTARFKTLEKSKGYRFYHPNHSSRIVKTCNAKFLENDKVSGIVENQVVDIHEIRNDDPSPMDVHKSTTTPNVVLVFQNQEQYLNNDQTPHEENNLSTQTSEPVGIALNKPTRVRKSTIHDDYTVYLQETEFDIGIDNDHVSFHKPQKKIQPKRNNMTATAIEELITQRVVDALADYEANQNSRNGNDNGNGSHNSESGGGRTPHTARVCTYKDFLSCQPLNFKGTKGLSAGHDAAYGMPWKTLMKMMTKAYCLRSEIKKLSCET
nr:hypothetical protein [Tanacetum cinerariifolium]